jgi:two-component system copper resistance phosphate regulon response regulator CusR
VKPFDFGELLARLRALIRRGRLPLLPERLVVGTLAIDTHGHRVRVGGREVALTAKEYALLEYLAHRAGDVVSRADIAEHVWDEHYDPLSNVVDVYVQRLRRKLDRGGSDSLIRTRRGEGYQLVSHPGAER